jgi:glutamyl-tRNA reductase
VTAFCELIAWHCGIPAQELTPHLYVHYEDRAVSHLLTVACGLDSMVVGEPQIVGQVRSAIRLAAEHGAIGRVLGDLGRQALRADKRARAETGIARTGVSLLSLAIEAASPSLPAPAPRSTAPGVPSQAGGDVLVVGAGSMSTLAAATGCRDGGRQPRTPKTAPVLHLHRPARAWVTAPAPAAMPTTSREAVVAWWGLWPRR